MSFLARWFARPLLTFVIERRNRDQTAEDPLIEGLNLLLARVRRMMREQRIERLETLGQAFDANTMNAIGTVDSGEYPSGHVAEQLSPCYQWQGRLLRFADVRVAASRVSQHDSGAAVQQLQAQNLADSVRQWYTQAETT
jgi:molecular chaperone GrpE